MAKAYGDWELVTCLKPCLPNLRQAAIVFGRLPARSMGAEFSYRTKNALDKELLAPQHQLGAAHRTLKK